MKTPLHIVVWKLDAPGYRLLVGYVDPGGAEVCVWGGWGRGVKKIVCNARVSDKFLPL